MAGIAKNGKFYVSSATIDDTLVRNDKTWSSEKISKMNISDAKKVDSKPTYSTGTITYIKDGETYTTTNARQWFYYVVDGVLKQTIFIDGEELTIDGANVDCEDYLKQENFIALPVLSDGSKAYLFSVLGADGLPYMGVQIEKSDGTVKQFRFNFDNDTFESLRYNGSKWVSQGYFAIADSPNGVAKADTLRVNTETETLEDVRIDIVGPDGNVKETTPNLKGADGADGVILNNVGYYGLRVVGGRLKLYVNVADATTEDADAQAPPFSLVEKNGVKHLFYTVGGTIQYESKTTL